MNNFLFKFLLPLFCFLLLVQGVVELYSLKANPHLGEVACDECHLRPATAMEGSSNLFVADIETLCLRCHTEITLSMSHPIAIKPSIPLPADMLLDWKGELTCTTCHYMHEHDDQPYHDNPRFLRRQSSGQNFCRECHQQGFMDNRTMGHSLAKSEAHYTPYAGNEAGSSLDESSAACLTCHDGSLARDEGTFSLSAGIWTHDSYSSRNSHPIGVRYRDARGGRRAYRDISALPDVVRLPDGKVECVSCHNPYSSNDKLLVIDNHGSRLCLTCHLK